MKMVPQKVQLWQADASAAQQAMAQNNFNRARCINEGVEVVQKIASITQANYPFTAGQAQIINIAPQNVGLIKRFVVIVSMNVQQSGAETHSLTKLGPANIFSQVVFNDLNNLIRVNTSGWHLTMAASARRQMPFAAAYTTDSPNGIGSNYNVNKAPATVTAAANLYSVLEIPLAYSDMDLRGAVFANVVNATMNLQLTLNPNFFAANTADPVQAVYQSSSTTLGKINSFKIDVYQIYIDQLPKAQDGSYTVPAVDLATQYNFINSAISGLAVGTDMSIPFANLRMYNSLFTIYDNGGVLNAGTDINRFQLLTANSMRIFDYDPIMAQYLNGRCKIGDDWPLGTYFFDFRNKPLSTLAYGNMELRVNPSIVNAGALLLNGFEFFAMQSQLSQAGAIPSQ